MIYPFNAAEAFKIAVTIEDNGLKFYRDAAKRFAPSPASVVFDALAHEEEGHKAYFQSLLDALPKDGPPTAFDPENQMDQYLQMMAGMHIFQKDPAKVDKVLEAVKSEKDAIELAIAFEKDSVMFFVQLKEASAGMGDRVSVDKLIAEEARHLRILAREYNRLFGSAK
ncbi:MAG: ferritin family protein [Deltaproteobacteria bacterium]|jgi:rubrerythrin|nr:ferritin family protein [Deltaproteobacteria bacterium]